MEEERVFRGTVTALVQPPPLESIRSLSIEARHSSIQDLDADFSRFETQADVTPADARNTSWLHSATTGQSHEVLVSARVRFAAEQGTCDREQDQLVHGCSEKDVQHAYYAGTEQMERRVQV